MQAAEHSPPGCGVPYSQTSRQLRPRPREPRQQQPTSNGAPSAHCRLPEPLSPPFGQPEIAPWRRSRRRVHRHRDARRPAIASVQNQAGRFSRQARASAQTIMMLRASTDPYEAYPPAVRFQSSVLPMLFPIRTMASATCHSTVRMLMSSCSAICLYPSSSARCSKYTSFVLGGRTSTASLYRSRISFNSAAESGPSTVWSQAKSTRSKAWILTQARTRSASKCRNIP